MEQYTEQEKELVNLLQDVGDGIANVFDQLIKGHWVDDQGHDVKQNKHMADLRLQLVAIGNYRHKYLGFPPLEPPK